MNYGSRLFITLIIAAFWQAPVVQAQARPSIAQLQTRITTLESQVATGTIPNARNYVTMDLTAPGRPTLRLSGANLQVVNGTPSSFTPNGLGNVIVGYDRPRSVGDYASLSTPQCSLGELEPLGQTGCVADGGVWSVDHKSGSHNVVIGEFHNYSRLGGLVAGEANSITGPSASAPGGQLNRASGIFSSVTGGASNISGDTATSVTGGFQNLASGAVYATVSGGSSNFARGAYSSVSGGFTNTADGSYSAVSGGVGHSSLDIYDWRAGGLFQND